MHDPGGTLDDAAHDVLAGRADRTGQLLGHDAKYRPNGCWPGGGRVDRESVSHAYALANQDAGIGACRRLHCRHLLDMHDHRRQLPRSTSVDGLALIGRGFAAQLLRLHARILGSTPRD